MDAGEVRGRDHRARGRAARQRSGARGLAKATQDLTRAAKAAKPARVETSGSASSGAPQVGPGIGSHGRWRTPPPQVPSVLVERASGDAVVDAIAAVEVARAAYLGVPADAALPPARAIDLGLAGAPVVALDPLPIASAGGAVAFGNVRYGGVQLVLRTGADPLISRVHAGAIRSATENALGAIAELGGVSIDTVDDAGAVRFQISRFAAPDTGPDADLRTAALVAIGGGRSGWFAAATATTLAIAHVSPAPHPDMHAAYVPNDPNLRVEWTTPTTSLGDVAFATDPTGRAALVWRDGSALHGTLLPGNAPLDLGTGSQLANEVCLSKDRAWARAGDYLVGFADHAIGEPTPIPTFHLAACGATGVVLRDGDRFIACAATCASAAVDHAPAGALPALVRGKLALVAIRAGVLAIYDGGAPRLVGAPGAIEPLLVMSDDRTLDVLARTRTGYAVLRL